MNKITYASLMLAAISTSIPAAAQESVADTTARLQLEQLRLAVEKARLEPLTTLASQNGSSASIEGQADTAEAFTLKHAVYRQALAQLVGNLGASPGEKVLVVFGSKPPSLNQWFTFQANAIAVRAALIKARADWDKAQSKKVPPRYWAGTVAAPLTILGTVISLLRSDSVIKGSAITVDDAALGTMLAEKLGANYAAENLFDLTMSRDGDRKADTLLRDASKTATPTSVESAYDKAAEALAEYNANKDKLPDLAKSGDKGAEAKIAAGNNLIAAIAAYDALKANLLSSTDGITNAAHIEHQRALASDTPGITILYILSHSAALTSVTKKSVFGGLRSTPATLRMATRIDYVWMKNKTGTRSAVTCLTKAIKFDTIQRDGMLTKDSASAETEVDCKP